jgi:hypothetical protein
MNDPFSFPLESPAEEYLSFEQQQQVAWWFLHFFSLFRGFKDGFNQGLVDGKKAGWQEGFEQGLLEGERLGVRIGTLMVPLLTVVGFEQGKIELKALAQELIDTLAQISLHNEEDPDARREQTLMQVEAKTKALVANFLKQHPQLPEGDKKRLLTMKASNNKKNNYNNKVIDMFYLVVETPQIISMEAIRLTNDEALQCKL